MIEKHKLLALRTEMGLRADVIEKDYVLGWVIAGIASRPNLAERWFFKGGTCLKKCYFETYRFSEDLDFTLLDEAHLDEAFLQTEFAAIAAWVTEHSGIEIPPDQINFEFYDNPRGKRSCMGSLHYRGPVSPTSGGLPAIRLDLSADEVVVLPASRREVFHPYPDRPEAGIFVSCYAFPEVFAEKMRALGDRARARDLYDVINLYRHPEFAPDPQEVAGILGQKCTFKELPTPTLDSVIASRETVETTWNRMLAHQLRHLPPFESFWQELPALFDWLAGVTKTQDLPEVPIDAGEEPVYLPRGSTATFGTGASAMDTIRFAAANRLCVDLDYDGRTRRIEPYSLRRTQAGNVLLHAARSDNGAPRSYRVDSIQGARITDQTFKPRYAIELTLSGPTPIPSNTRPSQSSSVWNLQKPQRQPRVRSTKPKASSSGLKYEFRCTTCRKKFTRSTMDPTLKPHKRPDGRDCWGTYGQYLGSKWAR